MDMVIIGATFQLNTLRSTAPSKYTKHQEKLDARHKNQDTIQGLFLHDMLCRKQRILFVMLFCQNLITAQDLV